jgi:hypothetical protein
MCMCEGERVRLTRYGFGPDFVRFGFGLVRICFGVRDWFGLSLDVNL